MDINFYPVFVSSLSILLPPLQIGIFSPCNRNLLMRQGNRYIVRALAVVRIEEL
eukprot:c42295_g1_i1 orf=3-161(-)